MTMSHQNYHVLPRGLVILHVILISSMIFRNYSLKPTSGGGGKKVLYDAAIGGLFHNKYYCNYLK